MEITYNLYPKRKYVKYFGKPCYKLGRKYLKLNELGSLYVAKIPGTLTFFGVGYLLTHNLELSLIAATLNHLITPLGLQAVHKKNQKERQKTLDSIV